MSKLKIILAVALVAALGMIMTLQSKVGKLKDERDRINNNYQEQVEGLNKSLSLTEQELRSYLERNKELDSLLEAEKIKPAKIKYITRVKHHYHTDTVEVKIGEKVQNNDYLYPIEYDNGCLFLEGEMDVKTPNLTLNRIEYNDQQEHIAYLKKKDTGRRFLWIFPIRKEYLELHTNSKCGENTVEQINIIEDD